MKMETEFPILCQLAFKKNDYELHFRIIVGTLIKQSGHWASSRASFDDVMGKLELLDVMENWRSLDDKENCPRWGNTEFWAPT